LGISLETS
jgi:hypothetical protein